MIQVSSSKPRVVVTGIGAVSSIGIGRDAFWASLLGGRSGVSAVKSFDTSDLPVSIGAEISDFSCHDFIARERCELYGRTSQLGIAASQLALQDANISRSQLAQGPPAIVIGTTMGESNVQEDLVRTWVQAGPQQIAPDEFKKLPDSIIPINICRELELDADAMVLPTACAAGNYALGHAFDSIRLGRSEIALAGGCDAFSKIAFIGFNRMLALAPEKCQPFDKNRQGIVIGEGAGILVLESLERALARNATIYAEMIGYALSCDAHHMTIPDVSGVSAVMTNALADAQIRPEEVDLISAHGTGTAMNDVTECTAVRSVFGQAADSIPVTSIKSMLGHAMGAASAFEAINCVMSIRDSKIAPTINFETPDENCPVDCVPNVMRNANVNVVLNNSFAFGGNNASTVFRRFS